MPLYNWHSSQYRWGVSVHNFPHMTWHPYNYYWLCCSCGTQLFKLGIIPKRFVEWFAWFHVSRWTDLRYQKSSASLFCRMATPNFNSTCKSFCMLPCQQWAYILVDRRCLFVQASFVYFVYMLKIKECYTPLYWHRSYILRAQCKLYGCHNSNMQCWCFSHECDISVNTAMLCPQEDIRRGFRSSTGLDREVVIIPEITFCCQKLIV